MAREGRNSMVGYVFFLLFDLFIYISHRNCLFFLSLEYIISLNIKINHICDNFSQLKTWFCTFFLNNSSMQLELVTNSNTSRLVSCAIFALVAVDQRDRKKPVMNKD